ncbi:MAG: type II toxin-antitoxin system VapC family toxin [Acidobacteria bacterium]|nr:type II toxin-antitoxin system VapC family toxin [Acidobacteriota bacterium]
MKTVLVDSDILIEISRNRDPSIAARWNELCQAEGFVLSCAVTIAELWHGVKRGEEQALVDLLAAMVCVPIDAQVGKRAGDYLRQYAKSHGVQFGDALIAATVSHHNVQLWTRNRRHYPMKDVTFF